MEGKATLASVGETLQSAHAILLGMKPKSPSRRQDNESPEVVWLRGYRCHTLWEGTTRIGRVDLMRRTEGLVYCCSTGMLKREERGLAEAKRWVEEQAMHGRGQLSLF